MAKDVTVYSTTWCPDCKRTKKWLTDHDVAFRDVDVEEHPEANALITKYGYGKRVIPTLDVDGRIYINPKPDELACIFEVPAPEGMEAATAIVGAGPAGLTAAIYLAREDVKTMVLERSAPGGQVITTNVVENYPGFPEGVSGIELMDKLEHQARRFGAEIISPVEVTRIEARDGGYELAAADARYLAPTVIVAVGSEYRRLQVPGADELTGKGVHYCATCDGPFYRKKTVAVVGGGNSAVEESLFLLNFVERLYVVQDQDRLTAEQISINELEKRDNVEVLLRHTVTEVHGEEALENVAIRNLDTDEERTLDVDGVFVFIGQVPNTGFLGGFVEMDERGYVLSKPGSVETNRPGVYVAGDCRSGSKAQITTAAGDATVAAFFVRDYLEERARRPARVTQ